MFSRGADRPVALIFTVELIFNKGIDQQPYATSPKFYSITNKMMDLKNEKSHNCTIVNDP